MFKTDKTVGMLKSIAMIAGLAVLLWSLGLPSLMFATAANLTYVSDTLSDSAPNAESDHTIRFFHPADGSGVPNGESIVITFDSGFNLGTIGQKDIDLLIDGSNKLAAEWSVATTATDITITITTGSIAAGASTTVLIGTHATNEGSPTAQIVNPASEGSKSIDITAGAAGPAQDSGSTIVVVMASVEVTANVDTVFTFAVAGVGSGVTVNGDVTTGTTSSTSIPFGTLTNGNATTSAQQLTVNTNATHGYVVTVQLDQALQSSTGADIDGFNNGSDTDTPATWTGPTGSVTQEDTWGHWGFTSDDATPPRDSGDEFDASEYAAASTSPRVVMSHDGPVNGAGTGVGTSYVGYKVQISALQEAGDDYSTILTYIATPTF
jgi:acyl-CoA hydrolase